MTDTNTHFFNDGKSLITVEWAGFVLGYLGCMTETVGIAKRET